MSAEQKPPKEFKFLKKKDTKNACQEARYGTRVLTRAWLIWLRYAVPEMGHWEKRIPYREGWFRFGIHYSDRWEYHFLKPENWYDIHSYYTKPGQLRWATYEEAMLS